MKYYRHLTFITICLCVIFGLTCDMKYAQDDDDATESAGFDDDADPNDRGDGFAEVAPGLFVAVSDNTGIDFVLRSEYVQWSNQEDEGIDFSTLSYPDGASTGEAGRPEIPYMHRLFAIPAGAQVQLHVEYGKSHIINDVLLHPIQEPRPITGTVEPFALDEAAYEQDAFLPAEPIFLGPEQIMRSVRFNGLWLTNYRYNAARMQLEVFDEIRVSLEFEGGDETYLCDPCLGADNFAGIYQSAFVNYLQLNVSKERSDCLLTAADLPASASGAEYLIITHPDFLDAANTLKDWKIKTGIDTEVRTTTQTGATAAEIKAYIQNAYDTWDPVPQWLLILGDAEFVPVNYETLHSAHGDNCYIATDLYYTTVDGDDYVPDISHGRIPVDTLSEANDRIGKIIAYENNPPINDDFYLRTTHATYFQDTSA
jgi:Peptidase family C25/Propeptide_C25